MGEEQAFRYNKTKKSIKTLWGVMGIQPQKPKEFLIKSLGKRGAGIQVQKLKGFFKKILGRGAGIQVPNL